MTRVERAVEIDASPAKVFGFVAAEWETDLAFARGRVFGWAPADPARLRAGFRVAFRGALLGVSRPMELEVAECVEPERWVARATAGGELCWEWRFAARGRACRVIQICEFRPHGFREWLVEGLTGRRRRTGVVEESLRRLKLLVERSRSLDRLRDSGGTRAP